MVNLVIMRHGEAEPQLSSDSERQLTQAGIREVQQMAEWLQHHYSAFDCIYASPYRRTQQTAQLVQQSGFCRNEVQTCVDLIPEGNPQLVLDYFDVLFQQNPEQRIVLVSHMPLVSFLVEAFTRQGQTPIFDTAGVACLHYKVGQGVLLEYASPALLNLVQHSAG